jgi:uncharacterized Zn finger protein (UPF0148 family)
MPETEQMCPNCGNVLIKGKYGLICRKCNKEFYFNKTSESESENAYPKQRLPKPEQKCPVCSWNLVQSPNNRKLFVCSNSNCPSRDQNDTPLTLDQFKNVKISINNLDRLIKNSISKHVSEGGNPPKSWEEAKKILLADYPMLAPLFVAPKPEKRNPKEEAYLTFLVEELLKKGWSENEIMNYLWSRKIEKKSRISQA